MASRSKDFYHLHRIIRDERDTLTQHCWCNMMNVHDVECVVVMQNAICPYVDDYESEHPVVVVPTKFLELITNNKRILCGALAHELGHIRHGLPYGTLREKRISELSADAFAAEYLKSVGLDQECFVGAIEAFQRAGKYPSSSSLWNKTHLSTNYRIRFVRGERWVELEEYGFGK